MIRNYLISFLRFLKRHKAYSVNNILGLSIGMAAAVLVFLWILDELSFDSFHENYKNIYRIVTTMDNPNGDIHITATAAPLAPALEESLPDILETARFTPYFSQMLVAHAEHEFYEKDIAFADREFFRLFTYPFLYGSAQNPFPEINSAVITSECAQKYFGKENPLGKTLKLTALMNDETDITVSGVIENVPANSHLHFSVLINFEMIGQFGYQLHWENLSHHAYALLSRTADLAALKTQIDTLTGQYYNHGTYEFHLQALPDVHLRSSFDSDVYGHSEPTYQYIRIFILIAVFILLISVINYINLSTARSTTRAREVSIRKVFGASRRQLIWQYMGESFLLCLLSYLIAMLLVEAVLPSFNAFTGKEVSVDYSDARFSVGIIAIFLLTAIGSGSYPALLLSSFVPARTLSGEIKAGPLSFRRILVILQFSISILLIICTGVVYRQLAFLQNRNLGIQTDQTIYLPIVGSMDDELPRLKEALNKYPGVKGVTNSESLPTYSLSGTYGFSWEGKEAEDKLYLNINKVDQDYIPTLGIEIAEGRNFDLKRPSDSVNFILNETAIQKMNMEDPIGKGFIFWGMQGEIIGVVKDYNFGSLHKEIEPILLYITNPDFDKAYGYILIKLEGSNISKTLNDIERSWNEVCPAIPFDYNFLDEEYAKLYVTESRLRSLFALFAVLSIFLSCLGLYGLSSFLAEKRTKEIGIRKAMGASSGQILSLFSWDAVKWVLFSNLIAWPVAWLYMNRWMKDFAYQAGVNLWIFFLSALLVLLISVITLSFQAQKVSRINPAVTLKLESS
jgi:putative ABC transport system permease protein